jgi:hypothetical protein
MESTRNLANGYSDGQFGAEEAYGTLSNVALIQTEAKMTEATQAEVKTDFAELAATMERAVGPDRELDIAVALALPSFQYGDRVCRFFNDGPYYEGAADRIGLIDDSDGWRTLPGSAPDMLVPAFTGSLDAAMRTVLETPRRIEFGTYENGRCWAYVHTSADVVGESEDAPTEAAAICAAALRTMRPKAVSATQKRGVK